MKNETVLKPHHAITARLVFTGREQDLMTLAYRSVKKEYDRLKFSGDEIDWTNFKSEYTFTTDELVNLFSLSKQGLYDALDASTDGIMSKTVVMHLPDNNSFDKVNLVRRASFRDGVLTLRLEEDLIRYFVDYSKGFSEIDLRLLLSLDGVKGFDKRILELVSRFKNQRDYSISLGEFSEMIGKNIAEYKRPQYFFESVLDRPIKRIIEQSDGIWTAKDEFPKGYTVKKSGRSYKDSDVITFKMSYNAIVTEKEVDLDAPKMSDGYKEVIFHLTAYAYGDDYEFNDVIDVPYINKLLSVATDSEALEKLKLGPDNIVNLWQASTAKWDELNIK